MITCGSAPLKTKRESKGAQKGMLPPPPFFARQKKKKDAGLISVEFLANKNTEQPTVSFQSVFMKFEKYYNNAKKKKNVKKSVKV